MKDCHLIKVWPFGDAPESLQALSDLGGDEMWIVQVPENLVQVLDDAVSANDPAWAWFSAIDSTGNPARYVLEDRSVVFIGAYS